tara:strand:+ start:2602 stop:3585 length:984 start_codon:yes stop_codon:yes gene_type:complete
LKKIIYSPGEPAGIGPDLILQLCKTKTWSKFLFPIVVIGDKKLFEERAFLLKKNIKLVELNDIEKASKNKTGVIQVYKVLNCKNFDVGKIHKSNANYVLENLNFGIEKTLLNKNTALVTGPISKENIISINKKFTGHTEHIKAMTKSSDVLMMLASDKLRVALATTHIPLRKVPKTINQELIINKVKILNGDLKKKFGIKNPVIKVLGLNPHAGENGKIGIEEKEVLIPAIKKLKKLKINVSFPISADTAFSKKYLDETDAYLGMYHDQVLPVLKALSFGKSINITLGVPIIRTSVDHGVALDIAGSGMSDISSLKLAVESAENLIR